MQCKICILNTCIKLIFRRKKHNKHDFLTKIVVIAGEAVHTDWMVPVHDNGFECGGRAMV